MGSVLRDHDRCARASNRSHVSACCPRGVRLRAIGAECGEFSYGRGGRGQAASPKKDAGAASAKRLNDYGLGLFEQGRPDEAIAILNRAVSLNPQSVLPHYNRGVVYLSLKRLQEAVADFSEAVRLDPTFALGYMNRGSALSYLGRLDEALADADTAVRLDPSYADAFFNRALVRVKKGMLPDAIDDYSRAIELNNRDVQSLAGRAAVWSKLGERDKAISDYRNVLQIDPQNRDAARGLYELHASP